jgi:hypothetical protein
VDIDYESRSYRAFMSKSWILGYMTHRWVIFPHRRAKCLNRNGLPPKVNFNDSCNGKL